MGYILPESFYLRLDPKIRKLVRILHEKWILTTGACEGVLDPKNYPPYPIVFIPLYPPTRIIWTLFVGFSKSLENGIARGTIGSYVLIVISLKHIIGSFLNLERKINVEAHLF
jgi:hypothetical protein